MSALLLLSLLLVPFWLLMFAKAARAVRNRTGDWITADDRAELPDTSAARAPKVSILVAARNEETNLGACLESLRAQTYPNLEVIAVDDRSEDRTFEVAEAHAKIDPRVAVLRADALPPGWYGKPHALHLATARATGDWLLFTDADTVHRENSVANGMSFAARKGADAISLVGEIQHPTLIANLVAPQLYAILAAVIERKKRRGEPASACGGYFLMTRAAFDRAGGMEGVKREIAEDAALERALHRTGAKYAFGIGSPALWRTAGYRTMAELHRGFARNEHLRIAHAGKALALTLVMWLLALAPIATAIATLLSWDELSPPARALGLLQYALVLSVQAYVRSISRTRWWLAPLAPIGALLAWAMLMSWSFAARPIEWKGRTYAE